MPICIPQRMPWTSQPQIPVSASASSPGAAKFLAEFNPITGQLYGNFPNTNSASSGVSKKGRCLKYSGTAYTSFPPITPIGNGMITIEGITVFALIDVDALSSYGHVVGVQNSTSSYIPLEFRLGSASTDSKLQVVRGSSGGYRAFDTGANRLSAGDKGKLICITFADNVVTTVPEIWVDKQKFSCSNIGGTGTGNVAYDANTNIRLGQRVGGATQLTGAIYLVRFYSGKLSDAEILTLYDNIYGSYNT